MAAYARGDDATALRLLRPLAEQGDASSQYNLDALHDNGRLDRHDGFALLFEHVPTRIDTR